MPTPCCTALQRLIYCTVCCTTWYPHSVPPRLLSPQGVEATLFATLMSLLNSGTFVGSALGSALTAWLGVTSGGDGEGARDACETPRLQPCAGGVNYWALRGDCPASSMHLHCIAPAGQPSPHPTKLPTPLNRPTQTTLTTWRPWW